MSTLPEHLDELLDLAHAQLRDELTPDQAKRLEALLVESPETREVYLDLLTDAANLRHWAAPASVSLPHRGRAGVGAPANAHRGILRSLGEAGPIAWSLAAALLLAAVIVAVFVFVIAPQDEGDDPAPKGAPVATLIDATGTVVVGNDIANPGTEYGAGEYSIESGSAQFLLTNRVGVDLQGPARLLIRHPMYAALDYGSASFHCPPEAKGYTVRLPDGGRVIDLGTRFRISIEEDGPDSIEVTEGAVRFEGVGLDPIDVTEGFKLTDTVAPRRQHVMLINADFSEPKIEAGYITIVPPGWSVEPASVNCGVQPDGSSDQDLFWNDPNGRIFQRTPARVGRDQGDRGDRIRLRCRIDGNNTGRARIDVQILLDDEPVETRSLPVTEQTDTHVTLTRAITPADVGRRIGVAFVGTTEARSVQVRIDDVRLDIAPSDPTHESNPNNAGERGSPN